MIGPASTSSITPSTISRNNSAMSSTPSLSSNTSVSTLNSYSDSPPARFNAGTGLGGLAKTGSPLANGSQSSLGMGVGIGAMQAGRPVPPRQESAPPEITSLPSGPRPMDSSNGAYGVKPLPPTNLQASRVAPPRPLLAGRPPPAPPGTNGAASTAAGGATAGMPSSAALAARLKAQGPPPQQGGTSMPLRKDSLTTGPQPSNPLPAIPQQQQPKIAEIEERLTPTPQQSQQTRAKTPEGARPPLNANKTAPPTVAASQQQQQQQQQSSSSAAAQAPQAPTVKPLQTTKKIQIAEQEKPSAAKAGVSAAAAALEQKPAKVEKEKRISTMTEVQIMEKLRSVVSPDDPKTLYSKIKKVGQG
jgi:serine/threonine-protein kinase CLA4